MADRVAATGVLLVGGASQRFGSPKAVAPFRGETLGERAWRILGEACEDVVAVGKGDGLGLPFPVLDDGSDECAPVFGVIAGLQAARYDTCVVLPVDTPLVTPELLLELLRAEAVPQTGPLPGVYARSLLPELRKRVARGELALRGVRSTVLDVDEKLLLNVNTRMDLLAAAIVDWAHGRTDVHGVVVIGSRARPDTPADRWSDLDALLFVDDPSRLAADESWIAEFGTPVLTFLEPTPSGDQVERRVLYEGGEDVDLPLVDAATWRSLLPSATVVLGRGYRVLYDELGIEDELRKLPPPAATSSPDAAAFRQLANDFWYHALWTARKLRRGEVFTAIQCLDGYLKWRLVTLLEWHAVTVDPATDTWHEGRYLERWADPGALSTLERAYAHYDLRDTARALWETMDLFQGLEEETARRLGLEIGLDHADLRRRISEVVRDPRDGATLRP